MFKQQNEVDSRMLAVCAFLHFFLRQYALQLKLIGHGGCIAALETDCGAEVCPVEQDIKRNATHLYVVMEFQECEIYNISWL